MPANSWACLDECGSVIRIEKSKNMAKNGVDIILTRDDTTLDMNLSFAQIMEISKYLFSGNSE